MAEGRGGVVKLSFSTDLVPNLQRSTHETSPIHLVHEGPLVIERDETRTTYLKELGIRVTRFENRAVFESLELVLNSIRIELQETGKGTGIA